MEILTLRTIASAKNTRTPSPLMLEFGRCLGWTLTLIDHQIYWTEQYLLLALLIDNPRTKLLFGNAYHKHFNDDLLTELMQGRSESGGASFWFEFDGRNKEQ